MRNRYAVKGLPSSIRWDNGSLYLLDQTRIPLKVVEEKQETVKQVRDSIRQLKVRGAPAIGIAGAYGLLVGLWDSLDLPRDEFLTKLNETTEYLDSARPTAVNLSWALRRMRQKAAQLSGQSPREIYLALEAEAIEIHDEDRRLCRQIGEAGLLLIKEGMGILTHCNAGSLATAELGTATAPMYIAHNLGLKFRVYADETRPLLQGARLTAWELQQAGLDVTLICDNMAAHVMSQGLINLALVGADRVAANGDVANKIGTLGVAILCRYYDIPFYVAAPFSTIDLATPTGAEIVIEERDRCEVTSFGARQTAPEETVCRNPAFDVTPNELVAGLVTEKGIIRPPYDQNLEKAFVGELLSGKGE